MQLVLVEYVYNLIGVVSFMQRQKSYTPITLLQVLSVIKLSYPKYFICDVWHDSRRVVWSHTSEF